jgi:energy-coupling factor transporter ATP-binding protein EcfA2
MSISSLAAIQEVVVTSLFGESGSIRLFVRTADDLTRRLMLLYGENGSGKTTVLELLFHALAPSQSTGHRTALANVRFNQLAIKLRNGGELRVSRSRGRTDGPLTIEYVRANVRLAASFDVESKGPKSEGLREVYAALASDYGLELYYVPEDRRHIKISNAFASTEESFEPAAPGTAVDFREDLLTRQIHFQTLAAMSSGGTPPWPVEKALQRFDQWLRSRALETVQAGGITAHDAVRVAVERIAQGGEPREPAHIVDFRQRVARLVESSKRFETFGLAPAPDLASMLRVLDAADARRQASMMPVMEPYLESLEARVQTYELFISKLSRFVGHLQSFVAPKIASVSVNRGIEILTQKGERLAPRLLSSGERQLVLLLTLAIVAESKNAVFIIDEPEISLNIKWQRMLLRALLDCTNAQCVVASHSIEILAPFLDSVSQMGRNA